MARFSSARVFHQITAVGNGHDDSADSDDVTDSSMPADEMLVCALSTGVDDALDGTSESFGADDDDDERFGFWSQ